MTNANEDIARLLPPEAKIDLLDLLARFLRHLPLFLVVAAVIMAGMVAYTLTRVPEYTATASVVINTRTTEVLKETPVVSELPSTTPVIDTEVETLNSQPLAERVVRRLNLQHDPEFNPAAAETPQAAGGLRRPEDSAEAEAVTRAARRVRSNTEVTRVGQTFVIQVAFTSLDPDKAARIANALVEEYVERQVEHTTGVTRDASTWLRSRLDALQGELQSNEAAVQQYKIDNNLMSAEGATMAEQEVSTLNQQIAAASADLAERRARLSAARAQVQRGGGGEDTRAALDSQVVRQLRAEQAGVDLKLADLGAKYGPLHPEMQQMQEQKKSIELQIQREIGRQLSGLEAEVRVAEQRQTSLESSRSRAQGSLSSNSRSQVTLDELQRKADASRAIYQALLGRANETSAQEGLQRPDAKVANWADVPRKPSSPNRPLNFAIGLVLALVGGAAVVLLLESLDGSLRTSTDVESKLKLPSLASVPQLSRASPRQIGRYVVDRPFSVYAEAFRALKTSVWSATRHMSSRVVAMTSALPAEGKTLTTLSFGRSLAQGGARTLIIDADLRRRMLSNAFDQTVKAGLVEVLEGRATLADAILRDEASGAYLLLLSANPPPERDLFMGAALPNLFAELRRTFEVVVLDTAPVLAVAETRAIAAEADATVLLVRWGKTPRQAAKSALELLVGSGARLLGACLTVVDLSKQVRSGYGDVHYYHGAMARYYAE